MRLQKQLARKIGDKEYSKYVVVIPPKIVEELNWDDGEGLVVEITEEGLLLRSKK